MVGPAMDGERTEADIGTLGTPPSQIPPDTHSCLTLHAQPTIRQTPHNRPAADWTDGYSRSQLP